MCRTPTLAVACGSLLPKHQKSHNEAEGRGFESGPRYRKAPIRRARRRKRSARRVELRVREDGLDDVLAAARQDRGYSQETHAAVKTFESVGVAVGALCPGPVRALPELRVHLAHWDQALGLGAGEIVVHERVAEPDRLGGLDPA